MNQKNVIRIRPLILSLAVCSLALLVIPAQSLSAGQTGYASKPLSAAHRSLIRLLGENPAAFRAFPGPELEVQARYQAPARGTIQKNFIPHPKRLYAAPSPEDRALILKSLERALKARPVSPDGRDLPLLGELNRLAGRSEYSAPALASDLDKTPEPNAAEIEPNDNWVEAQSISYGDLVSGTSTPNEDLDLFKFEAQAGDFVRIEVLPQESKGWVIALLFDPDSNNVSSGFYGIKELDSSPQDSRLAPIRWPGGNLIGASLKTAGSYYIIVSSLPPDIVFLDNISGAENASGSSSEEFSYTLSLQNLPTRTVTGRVTDDRGEAVAGAELVAWSVEGLGGVRAVSGEDGSFSLALPEGEYSVSITSPPKSRYPDNQISEMFRVGDTGAKLEFVLRSGVIFSGRTSDDRGNSAPYVGLSLVDSKNQLYLWTNSDEEGFFSVTLFPGTYDIYLYPDQNYPAQPMIRGVKISQDTEYKVVLDSGSLVSGLVLAPDGSPLGSVSLAFYGETDSRWACSDENGAFRIALSKGSYWIDVYLNMNLLIPDQMVGPLAVENDMNYDIQLASGGILRGSVIDSQGHPVQGAGVNLWPVQTDQEVPDSVIVYIDPDRTIKDNSSAGGAESSFRYLPWPRTIYCTTDENGRWQAAVMPGEYVVEVYAPAEYPQQQMKAGAYKVEKGAEIEVPQVTLESGVLFSGRVSLPDGSPLAFGSFQINPGIQDRSYSETGDKDGTDTAVIMPWIGYWVPTGEDGFFQIRVMPGVYSLFFDGRPGSDGFPAQTVDNVSLESDLELNITLQAGYLLSGRVTNPDGSPLEGSWLNFYAPDGRWQGSSSSGPDGKYELRLVKGEYYVLVSPTQGYFPDSTRLVLALDSDMTFDIALIPGVRVHGRVTDRAGQGVADAVVHLFPNSRADDKVHILPVETEKMILEFLRSPAADPANKESTGTAQAFTGSISPDSQTVSVQDGPNRLLEITGLTPKEIASWTWWPEQDFYAWTDRAGNWEMLVKPGIYDIYASATSSSRGVFTSIFIQAVDCTKECEINLFLGDAEILVNGSVEDPDGNLVPGTLVSLFDPKTGDHVSAYTDERGAFEFRLPAGSYELYAGDTASQENAAVTGELALDSDRTLQIRLGEGIISGGDSQADEPSALPRAFALGQNSPNPFNPSTTITYSVSEPGQVRLTVYDLRGRNVVTLIDRYHEAGTYNVQWDGRDSKGGKLSSGVYFYRMNAGAFTRVRKMVLLK
ncbi:MAG TPA: carboxypeptidase regulatory-like domain-containing protein [archaeon]|nr:carboxypeptidase regulatory-like domain-containing protein [archaeon]